MALTLGACSSDTMRFTEAPFANPFQTAQASPGRDPATTGSIGRSDSPSIGSTPAPAVASVRSQPLPPPQSAVALRSASPAPMSPLASAPRVSTPAMPRAAATPVMGSATGWSAQGGTPIVVAQGESLDMISSRYGVPRAALISANGLSGPTIAPGSRLTIPVYNTPGSAPAQPRQLAQSTQTLSDARPAASIPAPVRTGAAPPAAAPVARATAAPAQANAMAQARITADAKAKAATEAKVAAAADAKAKAAADAQAMRDSRARFAAEAKAKAEARKTTTAAAPVAAKAAPEPKKVAAAPAPVPEKPKQTVVASAPPAEPKVTAVPKAAPAPVVEPTTTASVAKTEESEKADFRWPARGRVIAGFGGKGGNEGINIAVPEGTPVKAAETGTVAYAGNELKGYGNLVLIRHSNGYVSAYAHNGDLKVKRGDTVKRGQVVASSGSSGNVPTPQLHFELRKGSSPVDPTPYLNN